MFVLLASSVLVPTASATPGETLPWGVQRVKANLVWDTDGDMATDPGANTGDKIVVAVIDDGIDSEHEDLKDNFKGGDTGYYTPHGTHVAGTIAAVDNNVGVIGVAPEVWLYSFKIEWGASDWPDRVARAIRKAAFEYGAQIISMSFGFDEDYSVIRDACDYAYYDEDALLIAAAGNENRNFITYPAKYDSIIAVGATDQNNTRWAATPYDGSNYGPELELVAPGVDINSTYPNNNYQNLSGTSHAVPHVSGVAALTFASRTNPEYDENGNEKWDNDEVRERLKDLAQDLGPSGWDEEYGYGLVDAILRDTAVTFATSYKTVLGEGYTLEIYATIENLVSPPETIDTEANVWDDGNIHFNETKTIYLTAENSTTTLTFLWDTNQTGSPKGLYSIEIYVSEPPEDIATYNNYAYLDDAVTVTIPGDINGDYTVGLADSTILSAHYTHSKSFESPGHVPEDWNADINGDCSVGLADAIILSIHYGETDP